MLNLKGKLYILFFMGVLLLGFNLTVVGQNIDNNKTTATSPSVSGVDVVHVAALEIIPAKANLVLTHEHNVTYLIPTIRFKISNTSLADVKVILFLNSITATDNLGEELFHGNFIKSSGIIFSGKPSDQFSQAFTEEKGKFIILAPKQIFEAQLTTSQTRRVEDKDGEFFRNHRPKSITVSATLGIINIDNTPELRAFSFSDLPVTVSAR